VPGYADSLSLSRSRGLELTAPHCSGDFVDVGELVCEIDVADLTSELPRATYVLSVLWCLWCLVASHMNGPFGRLQSLIHRR